MAAEKRNKTSISRSSTHKSSVSLAPLTFDNAVAGLLQVKSAKNVATKKPAQTKRRAKKK
jgi:hypothetical protein